MQNFGVLVCVCVLFFAGGGGGANKVYYGLFKKVAKK